jgi:tetratricopeptide (TPR) repeat protein
MVDITGVQNLLIRARLFLEEGQNESALLALEAIHSDDALQQRELAYLFGWCYTALKRWKDALRVLKPLSDFSEGEADQENQVDKEKLALCLLRLGDAAFSADLYEEAASHYMKCLRMCRSRKVNLPMTQIKATYGLAGTYLMRGLPSVAVDYYEAALKLCLFIDDDVEIAHIYNGLSSAYRQNADLVKAYLAAEKALLLYRRADNRHFEGTMLNALGRIALKLGNYQKSGDCYTEALAISYKHSGHKMIMINCTALADLRLEEKRLEEARRYIRLAEEYTDTLKNDYLCGLTFLAAGKIAQAEAREAHELQKPSLLVEAIAYFEKAKQRLAHTQAYPNIAEVYGCWAQALEDLGKRQEAIAYWKSAYEAESAGRGLAWY